MEFNAEGCRLFLRNIAVASLAGVAIIAAGAAGGPAVLASLAILGVAARNVPSSVEPCIQFSALSSRLVETNSNLLKLKSENFTSRAKSIEQSSTVQKDNRICLLYTSPSPRDRTRSRMPSSA